MPRTVILLVTLLFLVLMNIQIVRKENILSKGTTAYINLRPVDPRSLMQGDYMILRYRLSPSIIAMRTKAPRKGLLLGTIDAKGIFSIKSVYENGRKLKKNEHIIQYRVRNGQFRVGSGAYFFQEGHSKHYDKAQYGEIRLAKSGESILVGLRDKDLNLLGPEKDRSHQTKNN